MRTKGMLGRTKSKCSLEVCGEKCLHRMSEESEAFYVLREQ